MSVTQIAPAGLEPQDVVGVVVVNGKALAADAGFRQSAATLGLQYLVAVSVSEYTGPPTSKADFGGSGNVFGIDISSNRELTAAG